MLITIVLCLGLREWYPFTPFPLYASFSPQAWYVCLTDEHDRVVPTWPALGVIARPLRRELETRVLERVAAGEAPSTAETHAADDLLRFLLREAVAAHHADSLPARLRLRRVTASITAQHIEQTQESLGEVATR